MWNKENIYQTSNKLQLIIQHVCSLFTEVTEKPQIQEFRVKRHRNPTTKQQQPKEERNDEQRPETGAKLE